MHRWIPYIMVRVVLLFAAGILVAYYYPDVVDQDVAGYILLFLVALFGISFFVCHHARWRGIIAGATGLIAILFSGYLIVLNNTAARKLSHLSNCKGPVGFYTGLVSSVEYKKNSIKIELIIESAFVAQEWKQVSGKVLVYVHGEDKSLESDSGDRLLIKGTPSIILPPGNPEEFDLKSYLRSKNITHQHSVEGEGIKVVSKNSSRGVIYYSAKARRWAASIIEKFVKGDREQAITMALVLGVTDGIDDDLQDAYGASGAMHVLSVSGLHVGIIYAIVLLLLKPISALSWSRWLIACLSLLFLWAYAFITGLSPSVLRAVVMFSFMVIARPFGRSTNIYNTLAASAFLLLVYDPFLLLSVGFQLSYLAVLGIVALQRPLYNLWEPASRFWDHIWQITSVSLAAQFATFALGLYYFHQFPVYFLISNLLVIPVSTTVLVAGVVMLAVSPISSVAWIVAWVVGWLVRILNGCVFFVERLPASVIDGVYISLLQCWLLMVIIAFSILLFRECKFHYCTAVLCLTIIYVWLDWRHIARDVVKDQLIVYNIRNHTTFEYIHQGKSMFFSDSVLARDERQIRFHIKPFRIYSGVHNTTSLPDDHLSAANGFHYYRWNNRSILLVDRMSSILPSGVRCDLLLIGNNAVSSLNSLQGKIRFNQVILTSSNAPPYVKRIKQEALLNHIEVHSVQSENAFITHL